MQTLLCVSKSNRLRLNMQSYSWKYWCAWRDTLNNTNNVNERERYTYYVI